MLKQKKELYYIILNVIININDEKYYILVDLNNIYSEFANIFFSIFNIIWENMKDNNKLFVLYYSFILIFSTFY